MTKFTADPSATPGNPGVSVGGNVVTFIEDPELTAIFFYNDDFKVDPYATFLSFDYSFILGDQNEDYLEMIINFGGPPYPFSIGKTETGSFQYDLSSFRNQVISLAFQLTSSDQLADSSATISNLDLATSTTPVPEAGTLFLLGTGLVGLFGIVRKRFI